MHVLETYVNDVALMFGNNEELHFPLPKLLCLFHRYQLLHEIHRRHRLIKQRNYIALAIGHNIDGQIAPKY